jgi:hypothetical protein
MIGCGKIAKTSSTVEYFMLFLGGPACLVAVLEKRRFFGPEAKENGSVAHKLWLFVDLF